MNGRNGRFEALYRQYFGRVFRFFRSFGVADGEAQDLAQETFTRIYEHFDQYREGGWSYIETTARNVLYNWVRAGKTAKRSGEIVEIDDPDIAFDPPAPEAPDYAERDHAERQKARLARAIGELSEGQREVLRLSMLGFTYKEIAEILKITVDAVKSRRRDALRHLRARLGDQS